jgi:hypothetical protein
MTSQPRKPTMETWKQEEGDGRAVELVSYEFGRRRGVKMDEEKEEAKLRTF